MHCAFTSNKVKLTILSNNQIRFYLQDFLRSFICIITEEFEEI